VTDFELQAVVGKGAFGKVFLVQKKEGELAGKNLAMKVLDKQVCALNVWGACVSICAPVGKEIQKSNSKLYSCLFLLFVFCRRLFLLSFFASLHLTHHHHHHHNSTPQPSHQRNNQPTTSGNRGQRPGGAHHVGAGHLAEGAALVPGPDALRVPNRAQVVHGQRLLPGRQLVCPRAAVPPRGRLPRKVRL